MRDCGCDQTKLDVVSRYLSREFPEETIRDAHDPTREAHAYRVGARELFVSRELLDDTRDLEGDLRRYSVAERLRTDEAPVIV